MSSLYSFFVIYLYRLNIQMCEVVVQLKVQITVDSSFCNQINDKQGGGKKPQRKTVPFTAGLDKLPYAEQHPGKVGSDYFGPVFAVGKVISFHGFCQNGFRKDFTVSLRMGRLVEIVHNDRRKN